MELNINADWKNVLKPALDAAYFKAIEKQIDTDKENGIIIFPPEENMFSAFNLCPFENVKVILLGQDPYHGLGQANGLAFSVQKGIKIPPSLVNIFKELKTDMGMEIPTHGDLSHWAKQGVLLLNTALSVQAHKANSHSKIGWAHFTDAVIETVAREKEHLVFILWGANARSKTQLIDSAKHLILESAHPSPLSAYNGFWGSRPFSKCNKYLTQFGKTPIDWELSFF